MNALDRAESHFRQIWPAGKSCAHEYATAGFLALEEAKKEMQEKDKRIEELARCEFLCAWPRQTGQTWRGSNFVMRRPSKPK